MRWFVCLCLLPLCGCTRIEAGYVGIVVNQYGENRGVDDLTLTTGRVWYNPLTQDVYSFPTFMQSITWTAQDDNNDGNVHDEAITFNSAEGSAITADVALQYTFVEAKVPHLFVSLRQDVEHITNIFMRSRVRDAFSRAASTYKVTDIFGAKKQELLTKVQTDLDTSLAPIGIKVDMVSFVGALRVAANVQTAIDATIAATQKAIEAENKVMQAKAEAQQKVEAARGAAEAITLEATAKAEANRLLTASLSPELLQYEALQRWDGILPTVVGGGGALPFIQIPTDRRPAALEPLEAP